MNVWIDLGHLPQYNFYRPVIDYLTSEGHTVHITYLRRGRMPKILQHELGNNPRVKLYQVGIHRMKRWSVWLEANLLRNIQMFFWKFGKPIDVILSNGYQAAMVGWFFRVPSYSFDDDPQTIDYRPKLWFNTKVHYCIYKTDGIRKLAPKVIVLPALKEWSYLSPSSFKPNPAVLQQYGVAPKEYMFLREVSVGTMNYVGQKAGGIQNIADLIPKNLKVLFSLEQKENRNLYPKDWTLLQEPLDDVHSLIYYSCGLVSSGDSMAREAAMLGIPSYYLGIRHSMPANQTAHEVAGLQNEKTMPITKWLKQLDGSKEQQLKQQEQQRERINEKFVDIKQYILKTIGV
jgi:predicted glycosyltransferase